MAINFATGGTQQYPGNMVLHTKYNLNGNSTVQWSSIPAGVRRIMVSFQNVSHNSNANRMVLRIGDNTSGYMTSNYTGTWMHENLSGGAGGRTQGAGFEFYQADASYKGHGIAHMILHDEGVNDLWVCTMVCGQEQSEHVVHGGGFRSLSNNVHLDRVEFNLQDGQWDDGSATLSYGW